MAVAEIQYGLPWIIAGHLAAIGFDVQSAIVQRVGGVLADGVLAEDDGHQSVGSDRVRAEIVVERARHGGTAAVKSRDMVSEHVVVFGDASLGYDELRVKTELGYLRAVIERDIAVFVRGNILPLRRILQSILHCGIADTADQSAGRLAGINSGTLFILVPRMTAHRRLLRGVEPPSVNGRGRGNRYDHADDQRNRRHQPRQTYDHTRTPRMLTVHRFARTIVRQ